MIGSWTASTAALVSLSVLLFGMSKTAMPVAGVLAGPLLASTLGAETATGLAVPLLIFGDFIALAYFRQSVDWYLIRRLAPGVVAGLGAAGVLFWLLPARALDRTVGGLVLASLGLEVWRRRRGAMVPSGRDASAAALFFGGLAGTTTMAANAGGTALTLYLVMLRVPILTFMGTSAWFFFFLNVIKVPIALVLGLVSWQSLIADCLLLPLIAVGAWAGRLVLRRLNQRTFNDLALGLSGVFALGLLVRG